MNRKTNEGLEKKIETEEEEKEQNRKEEKKWKLTTISIPHQHHNAHSDDHIGITNIIIIVIDTSIRKMYRQTNAD